jgi:DNA-binding Lrp family transcriptional regulator
LDRKDLQIIRALQENGRLSNSALAEMVNLSPSPCLRRVRLLERAGIIRGYTVVLDHAACGLPITAFIQIRLVRHSGGEVAEFEKRIGGLEEVIDCYLMSGTADYLLRVLVADLESYETFIRSKIHEIPGIAAVDTSFAYGTIKSSRMIAPPVRR